VGHVAGAEEIPAGIVEFRRIPRPGDLANLDLRCIGPNAGLGKARPLRVGPAIINDRYAVDGCCLKHRRRRRTRQDRRRRSDDTHSLHVSPSYLYAAMDSYIMWDNCAKLTSN
jgi:hypothetical protein